jgi:hypothetical protein
MNAAPAISPLPNVSPVPPPSAASSAGVPSVAELEDMLYDILASGADPNLDPKALEALQLFVHEHARSKKSQAEFLQFFAAQSLPTQPERTSLLQLPPLESRARAAESPSLPLPSAPEPAFVSVAAQSGKRTWLWLAAFAGISGMTGLAGYVALEMRDQIDELRLESARNAADLSQVRSDTDTLRTMLRSQSQLLERIDQRSDRLLQTFATPLDPNVK